MTTKTRGLVFRALKYSETSLICDIYTEALGLQTYLISGVRAKKAKVNPSLLQVMSLLEMVVYHRQNRDINRTKELKPALVYQSIPFDVIKSSVGLFMVELARKTIREKESNPVLFDFLFESFSLLDALTEGISNYHLFFALRLSGFLGFWPSGQYSEATPCFDLQEGRFIARSPQHLHYLNGLAADFMSQLLEANPLTLKEIKVTKATRLALTEKLITYFQLHIENMQPLNSHEILREVLG